MNILGDRWLPDKDPYVHTVHEALNNKTVEVLMNMDRSSWDIDVVRDVFDHRYAVLILSIPFNGEESDFWFWKHDRLGHYTVKSTYGAMQESRLSSSSDHNVV